MTNERTLPELVAGLQAEEAALPATAVDVEYCERQQLLARMAAACTNGATAVDDLQDYLLQYVERVHSAVSDAEFARKAERVRLATDALKAVQAIRPEPRRSFIERVDHVVSNYYKPTKAA